STRFRATIPGRGRPMELRLGDEVLAENSISLHLDVERLGVDAKEARGLASLAAGDVKGLPNGRALRLGDRRLRDRPERSGRRSSMLASVRNRFARYGMSCGLARSGGTITTNSFRR